MADSIITSFSRYEVKYFLSPQQLEDLMPLLEQHLTVDNYGQHTISNLFFDTDQYEIFRASIEKPIYKEKLRVRAYGIPDPDTGTVFIELKKKYDGVVYKRRIPTTPPAARAFLLEGTPPPGADPQITREIGRFMDLHHPEPKVFLSYDRVALFGKEDPELRITFDRNLLWRTTDLTLTQGAYGTPILPDDRVLMEIKVPGTMPLWLSHALSQRRIFRTSFSKIGACYTHFILPKIFSERVVTTHV
jgi:hypothetical protein